MDQQEPVKPRIPGIYLLPNLFTTAALFAGFYSIVAAMKGFYDQAAIAIFVAMIMDTLDGRIARLTNTQSAFGAEYDSLSDMVAFGIAPALVIYSWVLTYFGKLGWLAAFIYTACAALRLARFNTQVGIADKRYFQGLPSPAAAGLIASLVWTGGYYDSPPGLFGNILIVFYTLAAAGLMVSNIRYYSFKDFDLKNKVSFVAVLIMVLLFVAISVDPPSVLLLVFVGYALSGVILTVWNLRKARQARKQNNHS